MPDTDLALDPLDVVAAGETDRGCRRAANEDALLVRSDVGLYVVADGAGGHSAGNVASAIATTALAKVFDASEPEYRDKPERDAFGLFTAARRLSVSVQKANQSVIEIARSSNKYRGMGTTIVCALVVPQTGRIHLASVGDSRCYRMRHGMLELLTSDHSILNDVMELYAELDDTALARLPRKAVTRALGLEERVRVSVRTLTALPGDRYLLCSDGLSSELDESAIGALLARDAPPAELVRDLVQAAKDAGGRDNVTAVVLEVKRVVPGARRSLSPAPRPSAAPERAPAPAGRPSGAPDRAAAPAGRSSAAPERASAAQASVRPAQSERRSRRPRGAGSSRPPAKNGDPDRGPEIEVKGLDPVAQDPEIVMIHAPRGGSEHSEPRISVVPVNSADEVTIRALDRVADALSPAETTCAGCGARFPGVVLVCPRCGHSQVEPLSEA